MTTVEVGGTTVFEYFKMIEREARKDTSEYSIKDLTIKMATDAGYHREMYKFANGSVRERTMYKKPFDSVMTAKWLLFYKKLFVSKLYSHPEFGVGTVDIINSTFLITMGCLQIDKITDDDVINRYVNLALDGRIKNFLIELGSQKRLEEYENGSKLNMRLNKSVLNQSLSLDEMSEDSNFDVKSEETDNTLILCLEDKLKSNPFGLRLLDAMLYSNRRIHLNRIDEYMRISEEEKNDDTKYLIACAYKEIKDALKSSVANRHMYDFGAISDERVMFSSEV